MDTTGGTPMKRAMVVTVGTGIGKNREEALKSIARAIVTSVNNNHPDKVMFINSRQSQEETLPLILPGIEDTGHEEVILESIDDLRYIYEKVSQSIQKLIDEGFENTGIIVDYTSGTKTMSAGTVLAAMRFEVGKISYVSGKRGERGVVLEGTERYITMMPTQILMQKRVDLAVHLFNAHEFEPCLEILRTLGASPEGSVQAILDQLTSLCEAYDRWDKFDHTRAADILLNTKITLLDISQNKRFLGLMQESFCSQFEEDDEKRDIELFYIADILNNGGRRVEEGRYDDAVARLYRGFELIAQWQIRTMGLCDEENLKQNQYLINASRLDEGQQKLLEILGYLKKDKVKLGLFDSYKFLGGCGCPLGVKFEGDETLRNLLSRRNSSVLAHGLSAVEKDVYETLLEKCNQYATEFMGECVMQFRQWAEFPRIRHPLSLIGME
jgi:CRISPR-associated protein (TIGR02710 family)